MKDRGRSPAVTIRIQRLPHAAGLPLPAYQSADAAGLDLAAAVDLHHPIVLAPGSRVLVPTGLVVELPAGSEAQVRPRSGLALKHGVTVLNSPGTIDADYRGEVMVLLINLGGAPFEIRRGERIAQLVVAPVTHARPIEVEELGATPRGAGGFGSTGALASDSKPAPKSKADPQKAKSREKKSATAARDVRNARPAARKPQIRSGKSP